jgi:diaminopropionate ammonia-lyase
VDAGPLAEALAVDRIWLKDETRRMGLGSFKALGAAYAIASEADRRRAGGPWPENVSDMLGDLTYVTASSGNHGMSVAAGAKAFGASAVVVLATGVPEAFATRLRSRGAEVVRAGADYDESMEAAARLATENGWLLLTDSSWPGQTESALRVMAGYLPMAVEAADQIEQVGEPPTHLFLQAGVGGMASSVAAYARHRWGDLPTIVVVEPDRAACLMASIDAGQAERADGPASNMGRLDTKEPSLIALASLSRDVDFFVTISDDEAAETADLVDEHGLASTPSGVAGVSAVHHATEIRIALELDFDSRVLAFLTEGPETPADEPRTIEP